MRVNQYNIFIEYVLSAQNLNIILGAGPLWLQPLKPLPYYGTTLNLKHLGTIDGMKTKLWEILM